MPATGRLLMRRELTLTLIVAVGFTGCDSGERAGSSSAPSRAAQPAILYTTGDGTEAWHIRANRFWSGAPRELRVAPLAEATPTVSHSRRGEVECISLDGVMTFGAPNVVQKGLTFRCGATRFEVTECKHSQDCIDAQIEAFWRTGVAPNHSEVPVSYLYNRCRGIQSITFSLERPLKADFGSTLELRGGLGLLAQPDAPDCAGDPALGLYSDWE